MAAITRGASSTAVQPVGSQSRPTILTRSALAVREMFFTSVDLQKPDRLYQVVHAIQQNLSKALRLLGSNPMISGNQIAGVVCVGGTQFNLAHGLGRPYQGFLVTSANQGFPSFSEIVPGQGGYPSGATKATFLVLAPANSGTFSFWVY
jgi:hypothetical protein